MALAWVAVASSSVQAEGLLDSKNLYVGASVGVAHTLGGEKLCDKLKDCKNGKVYAGYKFNDTFAVEGAYQSLANVEFANQESIEFSGVGLSVVASVPVMNKVEAFGRLGIFSGRDEGYRLNSSNARVYQENDQTHVLWGLGASYKLTDNWGLRGEYENTQANYDDQDIGAFSGGITFSSF